MINRVFAFCCSLTDKKGRERGKKNLFRSIFFTFAVYSIKYPGEAPAIRFRTSTIKDEKRNANARTDTLPH